MKGERTREPQTVGAEEGTLTPGRKSKVRLKPEPMVPPPSEQQMLFDLE